MLFDRGHISGLGLLPVLEKVLAGERLDLDDGERLFACPDIHVLGGLARFVRTRMHGQKTYYVINRHVNYTNVCVNGCRFCAFSRKAGQPGAFVLSKDEILDKIGPRTREVHIVGGCHPDLGLEFFADLLRSIKSLRPHTVIKAFTAVEIAHMARLEGIEPAEVLRVLKQAGLEMLPGGGAEIFSPRVRREICPEKISGEKWLEIAGLAHSMGIRSNATMLFGHLESERDRLEHLDGLRIQQDKSQGFVCFIPLPFLTENSLLKLGSGRSMSNCGLDELRTMAISRLMLDNIPHLKAYWVMLTVKQAQAGLYFGADDFDGVVVEEKIGHMAGAASDQELSRAELEGLIRNCGFEPVERDSFFNPIDQAQGS